jgi:4-amino-4-deoxy-L-arabinose transferase-like glycosyltransferase
MRQIAALSILIISVLAVAFFVRVAAAHWWQARVPQDERFGFGDSESYWVLAQTIVRGEPYSYGEGRQVFRTPGYPLLLAALMAVAGDDPPVIWARYVGAGFGSLAVALTMVLAGLLFDTRTAVIAGTMAALYPGAVAASVFILSEAPFCPLMLLQLLCWSAATRQTGRCRIAMLAGCGGLAAGMATLVRPSWFLFTPLAAAWALIAYNQRRRQLRICLIMLTVLAACMAGWWLRNYRVTGRFVPTTLQVGASLYDGLSPTATGASEMSFVTRFRNEQMLADAHATEPLESTFEYRLDRRMRQAAKTWAQEHPGRVVELMAVKFVRLWSPFPHAPEMQTWKIRLAVFLGYTPLLILGLWGIASFWRRGWPYALCLGPAVYVTCLHVVFVSSIRYRHPAMLALIVLSAGIAAQQVTWGRSCEASSDSHETDRDTEVARNSEH